MALILASQSPRRQELLVRMGLEEFEVRPAVGEERADPALSPAWLVAELSRQKAAEIAAGASEQDVIIAADTVVAIDGQVLGKPRDRDHAVQMLTLLSGRTHTVHSGVTVRRGDRVLTEHEVTEVVFRPLTQAEIEAYVDTKEPMDKAGSYGIQTPAGRKLVSRVEGDYYNIVGLPLKLLSGMLNEFGIETEAVPEPPLGI